MNRILCKPYLKFIMIILTSIVLGGCLLGCNEIVVEDEPIIIVDRKIDEITYNLDEVSIGDVVKTININSEYIQTKEQQISFAEGGKIVDKVYVREGDKVKKGDILVEVRTDNLEEQILDLNYKIKKAELNYSFLDKQEEFDKENAHITLIHSRLTGDDYCDYEDSIKKIERNYRYQREDYTDSILFDKQKLDKLNAELSSKKLYADMEGTVISIKADLEGSTTKRDDVIMTIVDNSNGLFETKDLSLNEICKDGDLLSMSVVYGSAKGEYVISPYNISSWGEKQQFMIIEAPEGSGLEVGTTGTVTVVVEEKQQILRIPYSALYEADGKYYTYTLDEDNMRKVQFIEIGLIGDQYVEVTSGLKEKDKVIKK